LTGSKLKTKKVWTALEHQIFQRMKNLEILNKKILLMVSGGADSVAAFHVLSRLLPPENLIVFHFHHGRNENSEFRDQALGFVEQLSKSKGVLFVSEFLDVEPVKFNDLKKDEATLRKLRLKALKKVHGQCKTDVIVTGHHEMDLLETRLMRMIRGTGPQGLVAMKEFNGLYYRPFLQTSPQVLKEYLISQKQNWIEDPSNKDTRYFRNWLRQKWLPALEKKRPGSVHRWSQSLELLSQKTDQSLVQIPGSNTLSRAYYLSLTRDERALLLAKWFYSMNQTHYTQAHIQEIIKQLDKVQNVFTFYVAGLVFEVNAGQITVKPS